MDRDSNVANQQCLEPSSEKDIFFFNLQKIDNSVDSKKSSGRNYDKQLMFISVWISDSYLTCPENKESRLQVMAIYGAVEYWLIVY